MAETSGGADQCVGGTPSASSSFSALYEADAAFDNDAGTFWVSQTADVTGWIEYQFTSPKSIVEIRYQTRIDGFANQSPADAELQYWNGSSWVAHGYFYENNYWPNAGISVTWRRLGNPATNEYYYWRVRETSAFGSGELIISEMTMATSVGGTDLTDSTGTNGTAISTVPTGTDDPANAFNNGAGVYTASGTAGTAFLGFRFDTARYIRSITIQAGTGGQQNRCFRGGVVEASNTGRSGEWTTIHTIPTQSAWASGGETRTFSF
jgi:hypothetical protein